jgi:hypothetical protein
MIRRLVSLLLASGLAMAGSTQITSANSDPSISPSANAAFADVARCLASDKNPSLSVLYLIDNSGSLEWTDPDNERKTILEGSIAELGSFVDQGVEVEVAAHFFSTTTALLLDWTSFDDRKEAQGWASRIGARINNDAAGGSTDWQKALELAYRELSGQADSCKMLVWFTDGGINPDNSQTGIDRSLAALCRAGLGFDSLGTQGSYGLMSQFRKAQIPVFGVLYSNLDNAYKYFKANYPSEADDLLAEEKWRMSFMRAMVEGGGQIPSESFAGKTPAGGTLQCAELQQDGTAPPEQTNGAFLNAADPVALAYQFLRLGTQISGGSGSVIQEGKFVVPRGTAKFVVIVSGSTWDLSGPEGSGIAGSASNPGTEIISRQSAGAASVEIATVNNQSAFGEWSLDTAGKQAELFLYTGLSFTLDRDRSSKVLSEYPNTVTGRIVRTAEFSGQEINLDDYPDSEITVFEFSGDNWVPVTGVEIEKLASGEFSIANFVPPADAESLGLLLRLDLGGQFSPVESEFELVVQDKNALARATTDNVLLSNLVGPSGRAEGLVLLEGPNIDATAEFCFADELRIEDTQTGIEKINRISDFNWAFANQSTGERSPDGCFLVGTGEQLAVSVSVENPTQADAEVVSVWNITSKTSGVDAEFEAPVRFQFTSEVATNQAVTFIVLALLMVIGLLLPLIVMGLLNFLTTRFLDVENIVQSTFPVKVLANGATPILSDARPGETGQFELGTRDFVNVMDEKAPRSFQTQQGEAQARIPRLPLNSTWYEWRAPKGARVITSNVSASKRTKPIAAFKATEISPNMAENWALVISDSELVKGASAERDANLVVFAPAGTIPTYDARIKKILASPRLKDDIAAAAAKAEEQKSDSSEKQSSKKPRKGKPGAETGLIGGEVTGRPNIPGFGSSQSGSSSLTAPSSTPNIPGFGPGAGGSAPSSQPSPPNLPGFGSNPGSPNSSKPPWLKD